MAISSTCVSSAKCLVSRNWTVAFELSRRKASLLCYTDFLATTCLTSHVALGGRGGLLWRAPALASVHVRRVPIPPVMLGMRPLVLAVMLLRLVEEIGHGCDVHGWCSRQLPFAAGKSRRDLLEQLSVPVWILKRGKRVVGTSF